MKKVVIEEDGKSYCRIHSPSYQQAKRQKADAEYEAKRVRRSEQWRRESAINQLTSDVTTEFMEANPELLRNAQGG
jgi:hypothetical protein